MCFLSPPSGTSSVVSVCDYAQAYVDATTFYLARSQEEDQVKKRGRLGPFVWRMCTGADGLFSDNVGPSLYAASQGKPVKMWGFLANGRLCYHILPADGAGATVNMTSARYQKMLRRSAKRWVRCCWGRAARGVRLVQDHEWCLWTKASAQLPL